MASHKIYGIIPPGELPCIWMDAGIVDYKLCDRALLCEQCPFYSEIRQHLIGTDQEMPELEPQPIREHKTGGESIMNASFEEKLSAQLRPFSDQELPADRMYSLNHFWFKQTGPVSFRVGIDHLLLSLLKSVSGVTFIRVPAYITTHAPCAWIEHEGYTLPLRMPLTVTITNTNIRLREMPRLLKQHPYENGWLLRLKPEVSSSVTDALFSAEDATIRYQAQAASFKKDCRTVLTEKYPHIGTTMYDGGMPTETLEDIIGPSRYSELLSQRFLTL